MDECQSCLVGRRTSGLVTVTLNGIGTVEVLLETEARLLVFVLEAYFRLTGNLLCCLRANDWRMVQFDQSTNHIFVDKLTKISNEPIQCANQTCFLRIVTQPQTVRIENVGVLIVPFANVMLSQSIYTAFSVLVPANIPPIGDFRITAYDAVNGIVDVSILNKIPLHTEN